MTTVTIPPIVEAAGTSFELPAEAAGLEFDLRRDWIDASGARWTWTGMTDDTGMVLMQTGEDTPERLSYVYWTYGPLIPAPLPITYADRYAVLTAPSCAAPAEPETAEPTPAPTPLTVAGLLARLRGRVS